MAEASGHDDIAGLADRCRAGTLSEMDRRRSSNQAPAPEHSRPSAPRQNTPQRVHADRVIERTNGCIHVCRRWVGAAV